MAGRPKVPLDLPKGWEKAILEIYEEGGSDVEVKAWIFKQRGSFSADLWERWIKEEPQFSETIKNGKLLCEAWWVKNGREALKNPRFNYTGWYMNMKNRFGWRDKQEVQHSVSEGQQFKIGDTVIQF